MEFNLSESQRKYDEMQSTVVQLQDKLDNLQVSFMNNGNVTIVTMIVGNSQIQKAVDL
jgi:DNA-binding protein YbaB